MIAPEHHDGVLGQPLFTQRSQQPANLRVHIRNACVITVHKMPRLRLSKTALVPWLWKIDLVHIMRHLIAVGQSVWRCIRCYYSISDNRQLCRIVKVPIFFWGNPGEVGTDVSHGEKERGFLFTESPQVFNCQVRARSINKEIISNGGRSGGRAAQVVFAPIANRQTRLCFANPSRDVFWITAGYISKRTNGFTP